MSTYGSNVTRRIQQPGIDGTNVAANVVYTYVVPTNAVLYWKHCSRGCQVYYPDNTTRVYNISQSAAPSENPADSTREVGPGMYVRFDTNFLTVNLRFNGWLLQNTP